MHRVEDGLPSALIEGEAGVVERQHRVHRLERHATKSCVLAGDGAGDVGSGVVELHVPRQGNKWTTEEPWRRTN